VTVRRYWAWETTATRGAGAHTGEERGGHIVSPRAKLVIKKNYDLQF